MLLAIETSCDETSVALLDIKRAQSCRELGACLVFDQVSSQVQIHAPYGGVVPELAAREHISNLPVIFREAMTRACLSTADLTAVAVTRGPGLKGCVLVGLCFAKGLARSLGIPLLAGNHIEAHIFAAELLPEIQQPLLPALVLVVSGGHTALVYVPEFRKYQILAKTRDDAAGEAFDKVATLLGLPYPGGPSLSARAENGDDSRFKFPQGLSKDHGSFSFSGLKTAVLRTIQALGQEMEDQQTADDVAASLEHTIVESLLSKTLSACDRFSPRSVVLTGGVAANRRLRLRLAEECANRGLRFVVPPKRWCTDNAAMVAALAARIIQRDLPSYDPMLWRVHGSLLGPGVPADVQGLARWPLNEVSSGDVGKIALGVE